MASVGHEVQIKDAFFKFNQAKKQLRVCDRCYIDIYIAYILLSVFTLLIHLEIFWWSNWLIVWSLKGSVKMFLNLKLNLQIAGFV